MTRRWLGGLVSFLVGAAILAGGPGTASAQVTGAISGRVEDATGAAVSGVAISVKSLETGAVRTGMTDETGSYHILSLPVGTQEVRAEKPGFRTAVRTGINLAVAQE